MPALQTSLNAPTAKSPNRHSIQWTFRTLSLVMGLLLLSLGNAAMALQRGDRGNEVNALQTRLTALGCYNSEVTGVFGPKTEAGVKLCQQQFNLTADGIAGSRTMAALNGNSGGNWMGNSVDGSSQPPAQVAQNIDRDVLLKQGDRGANVTELQQRLQNLGYSTGGVDGVYGEMTAAAVRQFQQSRQLNPDGKFGSQELAAIESSQTIAAPIQPSPTVISLGTLTPGTENSDVTRLQQRLKDAGYFQGATTQYYGSVTQSAVTQFQRDNRLNVTGVADSQTLAALGLRSGSGSVSSLPPAIPYASNNAPFNTSSFTNNRPYDRPATPNARYVVVIPKQSGDTLGQVRQLVGSAQAYSSNKGDYIAAGSFAKRSEAEKRSQNLRAYGLDARVDYQ
jgi:peptidoglycan hydrolase-like protein with peptidoglycan-binding domain